MARRSRTPLDRQPTVRLAGIERRARAALLLGTALQAGSLLLLATPGLAQPAPNAQPTGGAVAPGGGSATIATSPSTTTITQTSQRVVINWQHFDVGSQQTVDFIQPSASAVALNRVISANPSQIAGRIDANGQIILINQSGVIFYQGSQVNTAGLIVSAAGMSDRNFMAGRLVFDQAANPNAAIVNQGSLTIADAGLAALVAPQVVNAGVITATLGHVVLAGAKTATLDLYGDGMLSLDVNTEVTQVPVGPDGTPVTALVTNTGLIRADGGTVQLTARQADGLVDDLVQAGGKIVANSATTASGGTQTGTVVLGGLGGSIVLSGVVTADGSAPGSTGGQVQAGASQGVTLTPTAQISASGPAGGGTVAIGTTLARAAGGPGTASRLTAQTVQVDQGASIAANATVDGNGGRVTVLSMQSTSMDGAISAQGGPQGGNGGSVEVSGAVVSLTGLVNTTAPFGLTGTLLLDPADLWISDVAPPDATGYSWMSPATLEAEQSSITLSASGNIFLASTNPATDPGTNTLNLTGPFYYDIYSLTLTAGSNLTIDRGFTVVASGNISLTASSGAITLDGSSGVAGGLITAGQLAALGPTSLQVTNEGNVTMNANTGIALADSTLGNPNALIGTLDLSTASGGVSQAATGAIAANTLTSSAGFGGNVSLIGASNDVYNVAGPITGSGDITLVDNPIPPEAGTATLTLTGAITGKDLFFEVATAGGTLALGAAINAVVFPATLTAATGGRISLVADNITEATGSTVAAAGGSVELAPYSAINTSLFGTRGVSSGLVIDAQLVSDISTGATGTLVAGGFTDVPNGAAAPAPRADSISLDATADITSATAGTLDLLTTGPVSESAVLTVGTLIGKAGTVALGNEPNNIATLGSFAATGGAFTLADGGNAGALTIAGPVTSTMGITLTTSATGSFTATGSIGAGSAATLSITSGSGGITLNSGADLTGGTVALNGGSGGITLKGTSILGATGDVVDLTTTGGVSETTTASIVAATLQSTGGISGGAADLGGSANAIAALGNFSVTGNPLSLSDTGTLSITGPVTASAVTIGGAAGSTPGTITATGSVGATGVLSLTAGSGGIALNGVAQATGTTGDLSAGAGGIALNGTSVLGQSGATVDLTSTGGVSEASGATLVAATLQSSGGISGGAATLSGTANAIGTLAGFSVTNGALSLSDTGTLTVTGPVTASAVTIGGVAGSTPTSIVATGTIGATGTLSLSAGSGGIMLNGSADLTGATVALNGGSGGIILEGASVLGTAGDVVDLTTTGGVDEMGTASIEAATLQSSGGVTGAVALGNTNTVASVGQFVVSGTGAGFQLVDSGPLSVSGPLTAPGNITLSTNGSGSVTATGSIGAGPGATLSIASGSGGIALGGGAALTGGTITLNGGSGGIALEGASVLGAMGEVVDLTTTGGGVTESGTATIVALTLQSIGGVVGAVALGDANSVATLGNFTVSGTGNGFTLGDTGNLAVAGPLSAPGNIALSTGGAGSITATGSIGAGAGATLSIVSGAGGIALNGSATLTGGTIALNGGTGGISLAGAAVLGDAGAVVDLTTGAGGAVSESGTAYIVAATLQSSGGVGGSVTLTNTNTVATLGNFTVNGAGNAFQLDNDSNLLVSGTLNATDIALRAPFDVISLGNGASIVTGGTPPASPGPLVAAQEPQFGAPGAYIEAASFNQIGSSFLAGEGGGEPTLQISITNSAQFDPPLGLQATNGWLILNLAEGTAAGSVYVKALNVTYGEAGRPTLNAALTGSGGANLFGSIDGITSRAAASIGFIQPTASDVYLFNDCEIGGPACAGGVPPVLPPTFPILPGLLPPVGMTTLNLLALPLLPTPACALPGPGVAPPGGSGCALTDPDVVPPNVSYVDY